MEGFTPTLNESVCRAGIFGRIPMDSESMRTSPQHCTIASSTFAPSSVDCEIGTLDYSITEAGLSSHFAVVTNERKKEPLPRRSSDGSWVDRTGLAKTRCVGRMVSEVYETRRSELKSLSDVLTPRKCGILLVKAFWKSIPVVSKLKTSPRVGFPNSGVLWVAAYGKILIYKDSSAELYENDGYRVIAWSVTWCHCSKRAEEKGEGGAFNVWPFMFYSIAALSRAAVFYVPSPTRDLAPATTHNLRQRRPVRVYSVPRSRASSDGTWAPVRASGQWTSQPPPRGRRARISPWKAS
uniref:Uncharacterized protein n=1 Tax=Timema tahoe TaxID=61484 RepID=A0A7R9NZK1_9NEOP|nr:unnamed protein product [Timema tahoe]